MTSRLKRITPRCRVVVVNATDHDPKIPEEVAAGTEVVCVQGEAPRSLRHCDGVVILGEEPTAAVWSLCGRWQARYPKTPLVLLLGAGHAAQTIPVGSLPSPAPLDRLIEALLAGQGERRESAGGVLAEMIGSSAAMQKLRQMLRQVAPSPTSVLITGETGTGKELAARALHANSPRRAEPFVALNCAALPESLLESDLFGHARGAFTGALRGREGLLQHASGGTIFLDEIGDMPLEVQAKLLRALQERRVRPVGSDEEVAINIRVIAATHQDLSAQVRVGRFREDLLYRLNVVQVEVPPLRERGEDVLELARYFLPTFSRQARKRVSGISPLAQERLLAYPWPGNVRELRNCIERGVTMTTHGMLEEEDLPATVAGFRNSMPAVARDPSVLVSLAEVERRYILQVLELVGGNKARAARILGVDRRTLYRRLEQYEQPRG